MENKKLYYLFLSLALGVTLYLNYLVFKPFLSPILLGIIFTIVFYPVYLKLLMLTRGKKTIASFGVCALVTIIIILPLAFLTESIVNEMVSLYVRISTAIQSGRYDDIFPFWDDPLFRTFYQRINRYLEAIRIDAREVFLDTLKGTTAYGVFLLTGTIKNLSMFIMNLFLMLFTMYYLFKDSELISSEIRGLIPLSEPQKERIFVRLKDIIYATIYGTLVAGALQGFLGGLAFWALGISSPVIWGVVMGLLAIFPIFGAFLIWLPAAVILIAQGNYASGIILLLWGSLIIGMIDNLIWPLLVSNRAMLHPLAAFFSFLGGIIVFGPIGLFAGPFVFALFIIFVDIVKEINEPERISTGG